MSRNLFLVYLIVVIDSTIAAIVFPILPDLVNQSANPVLWYSLSLSLFRLTQLFSAPWLGYLADKIGRKPVLYITSIGTFISYLVLLPLNLTALIINRLMDGSTNALYTAVRSSITDDSPKQHLSRNLGVLGALGSMGVVLGPAIGAFVLGYEQIVWGLNGTQRIVIAAILLSAVNIVLTYFTTETKPHTHPKPPDITQDELQNLDYLSRPIEPHSRFRYKDLIPQYLRLWKDNRNLALIATMEIVIVMIYGYYNYFLIFANARLSFTPRDVSYFMVYIGILIGLTQLLFFTKVAPKINPKTGLLFTTILGSLVLVSYGLVQETWMMYLLVLIDVISVSLIGGIIQGLIGKLSPEKRRGSIIGMIQGFSGIAAFLNPLLYGYLGELHLSLPFFWFAICSLIVALLSFRLDLPPNQSELTKA